MTDYLALEEDLEGAWEEGGPRGCRIVLVAKVVPFAPFVDKDSQVGRIGIKFEKELVQVVPGVRGLQIDNDIDTRLNIE